jgi:hypothetical protein
MMAVPHFLVSLVLTAFFSFSVPIVSIGVIFIMLFAVSYCPGLTEFGRLGATQTLDFLGVFGTGCPLRGLLAIGLTTALVGSLFDLFNLYRYQSLRDR